MKDVGLIPLWNFGEIAPNLYRSAQPLYGFQYKWLRDTLGIKKIVNLRAESQHDSKNAPREIEVININVRDHNPPTLEQAHNFMDLIKDMKFFKGIGPHAPTLIHCEHGHGRTSTFSILAKMALGMTLEDAIQDEKERFHFEFRHHAQEAWLRENFG